MGVGWRGKGERLRVCVWKRGVGVCERESERKKEACGSDNSPDDWQRAGVIVLVTGSVGSESPWRGLTVLLQDSREHTSLGVDNRCGWHD
jgi:hypothetical protein